MVTFFRLLTLLSLLLATLDPFPALADKLEIDGTVYSGRVLSGGAGSVVFDFGCGNGTKAITLSEDMLVTITGDCSAREVFGIGGSEVCKDATLHQNLFLVDFQNRNPRDGWIFVVHEFSYDGQTLTVSIDGETSSWHDGTILLKRVPGDFCQKSYGKGS